VPGIHGRRLDPVLQKRALIVWPGRRPRVPGPVLSPPSGDPFQGRTPAGRPRGSGFEAAPAAARPGEPRHPWRTKRRHPWRPGPRAGLLRRPGARGGARPGMRNPPAPTRPGPLRGARAPGARTFSHYSLWITRRSLWITQHNPWISRGQNLHLSTLANSPPHIHMHNPHFVHILPTCYPLNSATFVACHNVLLVLHLGCARVANFKSYPQFPRPYYYFLS